MIAVVSPKQAGSSMGSTLNVIASGSPIVYVRLSWQPSTSVTVTE